MSREAMKLALEALKNFEKAGLATLKTIDAITAIKQALEQEKALQALHDENERLGLYKDAYEHPEPEPVIDKSAAIRIATSLGWTPKRKPLTDEQMEQIHQQYGGNIKKIMRAVEAAHGIKGEEHGTR